MGEPTFVPPNPHFTYGDDVTQEERDLFAVRWRESAKKVIHVLNEDCAAFVLTVSMTIPEPPMVTLNRLIKHYAGSKDGKDALAMKSR